MLEDVARHDDVEGLLPRPGNSFEEVAGDGIVEERSALPRRVGIQLDAGQRTARRTDASRQEPGAKAEIENGKVLAAREDFLEKQHVRGARDLFPGITLRLEGCGVLQSGALCAIGIRRPLPNAFADTFRPGAI